MIDSIQSWKLQFSIIVLIMVMIIMMARLINWYRVKHRYLYMNLDEFKERYLFMLPSSIDDNQDSSLSAIDMCHKCETNEQFHKNSQSDFLFLYEYVKIFLCRSNEQVNRPGPVCPFIPRSIKKKSAYFLVVQDETLFDERSLTKLIRKCRHDFFQTLLPINGSKEDLVHKCLIVLLRSTNVSHALVDRIQTKLKPEFVIDYGLMLGEFYQSSNSNAKHNPHFYPLRTQVPLLVIRYLVADDIDFLNQKHKYSTQVRLQMVHRYIELYHANQLYRSKSNHLKIANKLLHELNDIDSE